MKIKQSLVALLAVPALMLVGCTQAEPEAKDAPVKVVPEAKVQPVEEPLPPPFVMPTSCEEANTMATFENRQQIEAGKLYREIGPVDTNLNPEATGPLALQTFDKITESYSCSYPMHMEGGLSQHIMRIPASEQQPLIDAMRADPEFIEGIYDYGTPMTTFTWTENVGGPPEQGGLEIEMAFGFMGDIWIAEYGYRSHALIYLESAKADMERLVAPLP